MCLCSLASVFKQGVGSMRVGVDEGVQPQDLMHCIWRMGAGVREDGVMSNIYFMHIHVHVNVKRRFKVFKNPFGVFRADFGTDHGLKTDMNFIFKSVFLKVC